MYYKVKKSYFLILVSGSTRSYDFSSVIALFSEITIFKSVRVGKWVEPEPKIQKEDFLTM